ncbi:MAG: hypothetical protein PHW73_05910 [Atribacterota bacterium]|nr:hypothetical protein [Atribacterota bacterium]
MKKKTIKAWALVMDGLYGRIGIPCEDVCGFTEPIFESRKRALKYKEIIFRGDKRIKVIPITLTYET